MTDVYSHILFLSEENIGHLMSGKSSRIQGFCTKIKPNLNDLDFTNSQENIAFYDIKFSNNENIESKGKKILITISDKNANLYDFIYDSFDENKHESHKYTFKINKKTEEHTIVVTTIEYFDKSKTFV
jgi:hypothetical protein